jgi:glucose/arabinose dehydrogenase
MAWLPPLRIRPPRRQTLGTHTLPTRTLETRISRCRGRASPKRWRKRRRDAVPALAAALGCAALLPACYHLAPSRGGGQTDFEAERRLDVDDIALPPGYRIEVVARDLDLPTGVAFARDGRPYVTEAGYAYGEVWATPRLVRIDGNGSAVEVLAGEDPPWNGLTFHDGAFFIAAAGHGEGGRILRVRVDGAPGSAPDTATIVSDLPSLGDHHTNGPLAGHDGWLYFGQGTATNAGIVGEDNHAFGWLSRHPDFHDIACRDITLAGRNFTTGNPLADPDVGDSEEATTGAFLPFGTPSREGQVIRGEVPCSGAVLRVRPEGGELELVAWGMRNPFGLAWDPQGELYVTDNGYDRRGSRPVFGGGDLLWKVERPDRATSDDTAGASNTPGTPGAPDVPDRAGRQGDGIPRWHGWPDFSGDRPLDDRDWFRPPGGPSPGLLLAEHPDAPPSPAAIFAVHSSSNGFDFSRNAGFGFGGWAFVAQFGDMAPEVGKVLSPVGFKVVRVDPATGVVRDFVVNRGGTNGPASRLGTNGIERPVAARFNPEGTALYIVDFGVMTVGDRGPEPRRGTGVLWRVTRARPQ